MTLGQTLSLVTLCVLVYLTGSSSWYSFEEHHTYSDSSDINFEFYIDEIDTDSYYDFDYDNLGDMEDKMSKGHFRAEGAIFFFVSLLKNFNHPVEKITIRRKNHHPFLRIPKITIRKSPGF